MDTRKDVHPALSQPKKFIQLKDVPPELHMAIRLKALAKNMTMQEFILDVVEKAVKQ